MKCHRVSRRSRNHSSAHRLRAIVGVFMFALLLLVLEIPVWVVIVVAQQQYTETDLQAMTETELEDICIQRGFILKKDEIDPSTGNIYELTHDDYVEAALKCLAIEEEMNELLQQYPELAEELEEEIKRMEAENAARQAELEQMQQHIGDSGEQIDLTDEGTAAFVPKVPASSDDTSPENESSDPGKSANALLENDNSDDSSIDDSTDNPLPQTDETQSDAGEADEITTKEVKASTDTSSEKENFELTNLVIETLRAFVKHAKDDVKRIIELIVPVMQPLLTAGDVAWRQIKALFLKAREAYETSESSPQDSEEENNSKDNEVQEKR